MPGLKSTHDFEGMDIVKRDYLGDKPGRERRTPRARYEHDFLLCSDDEIGPNVWLA